MMSKYVVVVLAASAVFFVLCCLLSLLSHWRTLSQFGIISIYLNESAFRQRWSGTPLFCKEAKDSNWVPALGDEYTDKLLVTRRILAESGVQFGLYAARVKDLYQWALSLNINRLHTLKVCRQNALGTLSEDYLEYVAHKDELLQCVYLNSGITIEALSKECQVTQWVIWHLILDELVCVELWCSPLGPSTAITALTYCPNKELGLFRRALLALRNTSWEVLCDQ